MDSPLEACGVYLQHYEPYLKDPVGFPRVMVSSLFNFSLCARYQHIMAASLYIEIQRLSEDRPPQERIIRQAASSRAPMMNFQPQPFGADSFCLHICTSEPPSKWCGSLDNSPLHSALCLCTCGGVKSHPDVAWRVQPFAEAAGGSSSPPPRSFHLASPCLSCETKMMDNRFWPPCGGRLIFYLVKKTPALAPSFCILCWAYTPPSIGYPKTLLLWLQCRHKTIHWSDRSTTWWELDKLILHPKPSLGGACSVRTAFF